MTFLFSESIPGPAVVMLLLAGLTLILANLK